MVSNIFYSIYLGNQLKAKVTIDALDTWIRSLELSGVDLDTLVITVENKGE
jgi:hypothetical protein